jgi:tetratricopeptide (TPR) repeat protein
MSKFCVRLAASGRRRISITKLGHWATVAIVLSTSVPAFAQSAADKATARQLATQGIQYYQQGKNSDALELLQKAQQLYDAPVHLIYIGRAQAALGKLVEAAETFRRLIRTDLPAGAPQAFKDAVSDAHKELQTLEPKIPSLRIDVAPANAAGLQLKLDGEALSAVVVGINRPTNPGKHTVEVTATGFEPASGSVELAHGVKQTISLQLKPKPGMAAALDAAAASPTAPDQGGTATAGGAASTGPTNANVAQGKPAEEPFDQASQILLGVRGILSQPMGTLHLGNADQVALNGKDASGNPNTDAATKDRFGIGSGMHLHAGYRLGLGKRFALAPNVAYETNWFMTGPYYQGGVGSIVQDYRYASTGGSSSSVLQLSRRGHTVLLGAAAEFPMASAAWSPSAYAELSFIVYDLLSSSGTLTTGTSTCKITDKYTGRGLKFGAGILLPATRVFRLAAGVSFSAVSATTRDYSDDCPRSTLDSKGQLVNGLSIRQDFSGSDQKLHSLFTLGIGGDFLIGL